MSSGAPADALDGGSGEVELRYSMREPASSFLGDSTSRFIDNSRKNFSGKHEFVRSIEFSFVCSEVTFLYEFWYTVRSIPAFPLYEESQVTLADSFIISALHMSP